MNVKWIFGLLLVSFAALSNSQTLVGSFTVNYRYNSAGCPDADSNAYNPYQCPGLIAPGAVAFDNLPAGQYQLIVTAVGPLGAPGVVIWTGNPATAISSNTGYTYQFAANPQIVGSTTSFTTTNVGTIAFFAHDWYPYDNDAGFSSTFLCTLLASMRPPTSRRPSSASVVRKFC